MRLNGKRTTLQSPLLTWELFGSSKGLNSLIPGAAFLVTESTDGSCVRRRKKSTWNKADVPLVASAQQRKISLTWSLASFNTVASMAISQNTKYLRRTDSHQYQKGSGDSSRPWLQLPLLRKGKDFLDWSFNNEPPRTMGWKQENSLAGKGVLKRRDFYKHSCSSSPRGKTWSTRINLVTRFLLACTKIMQPRNAERRNII